MNYQKMSDEALAAQIKFLQRQVTEGNSMVARNQLKEAKVEESRRKPVDEGTYEFRGAKPTNDWMRNKDDGYRKDYGMRDHSKPVTKPGGFASLAGTHKPPANVIVRKVHEEEEQVNELSKATLNSYSKKAHHQLTKGPLMKRDKANKREDGYFKAQDRVWNTPNAPYRAEEVERVDEISMGTLTRYKTAAGVDAKAADSKGDYKRADKRFSGMIKATNKQFDKDQMRKEETELEESLTKHPMYHPNDHKYLKDKGYKAKEIKAIWDRDHKDGKSPVTVNKNDPKTHPPGYFMKTGVQKEDAEQIDELRTSTLLRYSTKANKDQLKHGAKGAAAADAGDMKTANAAFKKSDQRMKGQQQAMSKIQKRYAEDVAYVREGDEEQITELSRETLRNYTKVAKRRNAADIDKRTIDSPYPSKIYKRATDIGKAQNKLRKMNEAATDDKNPTAHGAEKMPKMDGRGTDAAVKSGTGSSTFCKNPKLLGRNADVESGKQWMVSFVNGLPDCLVPGETENEVVARMRMFMTDPTKINQVTNIQKTVKEDVSPFAPMLVTEGEDNVIVVGGEAWVFESLEDIPFFETADLYMALVNADACSEFIQDVNAVLEHVGIEHELTINDITSVLEALDLDEDSINEITNHL